MTEATQKPKKAAAKSAETKSAAPPADQTITLEKRLPVESSAPPADQTITSTSISLNGYQLREALEYLAPDDSPEQLAEELELVYSVAGGHSGAGVYAHHVECPEEGSILLTGAGYETARQTTDDMAQELLQGTSSVEPAGLFKASGDEYSLTPGMQAVLVERARMIAEKGYVSEVDDVFTSGQLVQAGACYAALAAGGSGMKARAAWPFSLNTFKPGEPTRDLVKAAQFLIAELDRRHRAGDPLLTLSA